MMGEIDELRKMINQADSDILKLVEDRFEIVKEIGKYKKARKLPIEDLKRKKRLFLAELKVLNLTRDLLRNFLNCCLKKAREYRGKYELRFKSQF